MGLLSDLNTITYIKYWYWFLSGIVREPKNVASSSVVILATSGILSTAVQCQRQSLMPQKGFKDYLV